MQKFLRVNMEDLKIVFEEGKEEFKLLGGRGLIAKLMNEECNPTWDALLPDNKLIICTGLLADTAAPCSGRVSIGGKSPLTGTIKEANAGGIVAKLMAKIGLKAIIIENQPAKKQWFILKVSREGVELLPAEDYLGLNNYDLTQKLKDRFGKHIGIMSIGTAGERGYKNSSVQITDTLGRPSRAAARGGMGSVMASKGIKAIVIDGKGTTDSEYYDREKFMVANKNFVEGIRNNPVSGQGMPALGTAVLVNAVNGIGALPTRNFSCGQFEDAEKISGEHLAALQKNRGGRNGHTCHPGCVIGCSNIYHDANGEYLTASLEFETIGLCGSNCGISDLDVIAKMDRMCDDIGLDTMETGAAIAVCMEAGLLKYGDGEGALKLIQEMADGTELGITLGQGTEYTGKKLGVTRIPTVKGQALASYDPRSLKGTGVTYATSTMGADHTAGNAIGLPNVDPHHKKGQVEASRNMQIMMSVFDNLGMCIFASFCTAEQENLGYLLEMMEGKFGGEWNVERLMGLGIQTLSMEKAFNQLAGFTKEHDKLPDFFYSEPLPPHNMVFDLSGEELEKTLIF